MEKQVLATRENYRMILDDIAAEFGLNPVTSVDSYNGYPSGIITLLDGLESEEQVEQIKQKYPQIWIFELWWKNGWNTRFRLNSDCSNTAYTFDDEVTHYCDEYSSWWQKSDNPHDIELFYLGESCEDDARNAIWNLHRINKTLSIRNNKPWDECGIAEYQNFLNAINAIVEDIEFGDNKLDEYDEENLSEAKEHIEKIEKRVEMTKEFVDIFNGMDTNEGLVIDLDNYARVFKLKSMSYYDGDVTHKCLAVGFDPDSLPKTDTEE